MALEFSICELRWERYQRVSENAHAREWLQFQAARGLAANTLDAYGRDLDAYLRFLASTGISFGSVTRSTLGAYIRSIAELPAPRVPKEGRETRTTLSNATLQQHLTVVRLFHDFLVEENICTRNPLRPAVGGRSLIQRHHRIPWIPSEEQWQGILQTYKRESLRNRVMLAMSYDAALRREEICSLETTDIDPAHRLLRIRLEATKGRPAMKILLLKEMLKRARGLWGWTEDEWLETIKQSARDRHFVTAAAYLLCGFDGLHRLGRRNFVFCCLAHRVFGRERLHALFSTVKQMLVGWGYREKLGGTYASRVLCELFVTNRSPRLEDLTLELLQTVERRRVSATSTWCLSVLSKVLASRGIISAPIMRMDKPKRANPELTAGVSEKWVQAAKYWFENGTRSPRLRRADYYFVLAVGRWLAAEHPTITSPEQWDRSLAVRCLTMITNMRCGDWRAPGVAPWGWRKHYGRPLKPATKMQNYTAVRTFFADLQEWGVIPPRFDPYRSFTPPRSVKALLGSSPRVIADDVWAKLLWAGLNLTPEDFVRGRKSNGEIHTFYPIEMIRALTVVWLFAGLRGDEIRRLRVGCVRWQQDNAASVCFLDVPVSKTATAFTKPVDKVVGQAINAWEKVRPLQAKLCDKKTGEMVDFLFLNRMRPIGEYVLNKHLIPRLCRKAGVPQHDVRGPITSHRARSTIATQLFNAKEPMSLFELQEWLGHRLPSSTQRYAKITPTKLMKSYSDAGYFGRNLRAIEVLIDQEKVRAGVGAKEAWKFYDLGHGYCTYDFFDQCPHRMACAKCSFYLPKESTAAVLLEGKSNLLRMRQEIPLSEAELAALDDGVSALESLLSRLADVPTPAGQTPVQLRPESLVQIDATEAAD